VNILFQPKNEVRSEKFLSHGQTPLGLSSTMNTLAMFIHINKRRIAFIGAKNQGNEKQSVLTFT
jgi:hypothetical protein